MNTTPNWLARLAAALVATACLCALLPAAAGAQTSTAASFRPDPRIVGGSEVPDDRYEFMTFIVIGDYVCGGALVAPEWIMTAAHCTEGVTAAETLVVVGRRDLADTSSGVIRNALGIVAHPDFDTFELSNDIAFINVDPITNITPLNIGTIADQSLWTPGTMATVAGWGYTLTLADPVNSLHAVNVPVVSDADCLNSVVGPGITADVVLCAGAAGFDACDGDSGGPLFVDDPSGGHVALGIVSWGIGCAEVDTPGVYTELTAMSSFINETLDIAPMYPPGIYPTVTCLAGNGRIDVNVLNTDTASHEYRLEVGALNPRVRTVAAGDWWRSPVTGRPDGPISVRLLRDGAVLLDTDLMVACDTNPMVTGPEAQLLNVCRGGNGFVAWQFANPTNTSRSWIVSFEGLSNRSTTAAPYGASVRGVSGRPDGVHTYEIRSGATVVASGSVTVACD